MKKQRVLCAALVALVLMVFSGCAENTSDKKLQVTFGDAGWDSFKFHNAVAMLIGEAAYSLETTEISGSTAVTYSALLGGEIQVYMETWSDTLATYDDDVASGDIVQLSVNYDDNVQGLYVPRYVLEGDPERGIEATAPGLKTVEDLLDYSDVFTDPDDTSKGRIYGAINGWEVDTILRNKYEYYGLDKSYNYMDPGSDAALSAAIAGAYEKGVPIVAYYWEPTWLISKYDLVLLADAPFDKSVYMSGKCEFPSTLVTVCVNGEFADKAAEYCEFLSKYKTSSALTSEALLYIQETGATSEDAAKWFLKNHNELLDEWLPAAKAELVRKTLAD